eukprot:11180912-Lingulodinium_polyedra.AAC.1
MAPTRLCSPFSCKLFFNCWRSFFNFSEEDGRPPGPNNKIKCQDLSSTCGWFSTTPPGHEQAS